MCIGRDIGSDSKQFDNSVLVDKWNSIFIDADTLELIETVLCKFPQEK